VACGGQVLEISNPPFPNYQTLQQFLFPVDQHKTLVVYASVNNFKGENIKAIKEDSPLTVITQSYILSSSQNSNIG
jgi:hypothetical protein